MHIEKISGYGPNWAKAKKFVLERDHYTCVKCGFHGTGYGRKGHPATVHVHHKKKIRFFVVMKEGKYKLDYEAANDPSNLETLCFRCHPVADGHRPRIGMKNI